jgi:hypothetical protein
MGFTVNLYTFAKKINSTAKPGDPQASYDCIIKEPCSIISPVIVLDLGLTFCPQAYNYAYIPAFDRYYTIKDWTFENALWSASMQEDVLASWRGSIGNSTCYILRSASTKNGGVMDTTYPGISTTVIDYTQVEHNPWNTDNLSDGCYVVGVAGQSTTYYLFLQGGLDLFFAYLFSDAYADSLYGTGWASAYPQLKSQTNPLQYITSVMWFPFQTVGTAVDSIRVGWVDVPAAAWKVDGSGMRSGMIVFSNIKKHPQSDTRGQYLNNAPYSNYTLFVPPWGVVHLDADIIANVSEFTVQWLIDLRTGHATMSVMAGVLHPAADGFSQGHVTSWLHSQVGVPYQVSQVVNRGYGAGNTIVPAIATAASIATGNIAGAAATVAGEIGNFVNSKVPSATTIGSNGGIDSLRGTPTLQYEFKYITDDDNENRGSPLCDRRQISTLSGYIKVANAYIDIAANQTEKDAIVGFMEGGFFYEYL